ncbi:hypothetical protein LWT82_23700 [Enterobacter ludwigii]|nr:hypothetical protein [Enterobacter ludwigii]MCE1613400.1 hypothetical protein [Enterobacter ludwigii]MCE1626701.1 hypothetical protein [Enterobacter ludwigii]
MMVLVLLGIASSLVIGRFFATDPSVSKTITSLKGSLKYIQEQAVQQEMLFGLIVTKTGWQPVKYCGDNAAGKNKWCKAGSFYSLPGSGSFSLNIERQNITLLQHILPEDVPQLWFMPDGESTVFRLCVSQRHREQCLNGEGFMSFESEGETFEKE